MAGKPAFIQEMSDFDESINMMVYSSPGIGKTVFGGTAKKGIIVGTEKGSIAAKRQGSKCEVALVESWSQLQEVYDYLYSVQNQDVYDWVTLDSVGAMQYLALRSVLDAAVVKKSDRDPDTPELQDHQPYQNKFKRFIRAFCDLSINTLFTAHEVVRDGPDGDDLIMPLLQGGNDSTWVGITNWMMGEMSLIAYMELNESKKTPGKYWRRFYTQPRMLDNGKILCKDRYDVFGEKQDNLTLPKVAEMIQNLPPQSVMRGTKPAAADENKQEEKSDA